MEKVTKTITNRPIGAQLRDSTKHCLGYADDIVIITEDIKDTNAIMETFEENAGQI